MYTVDALDRVIELEDVPQSSIGAPDPMIYATEQSLCLAYIREYEPGEWNQSIEAGRVPPVFCILVEFERPSAHLFGPPNDEAIEGHPLAERGLGPYALTKSSTHPGFALTSV